MKASIAHGIRPSALILGRDSKKPWTATDILFAKAYQRFLNEICPQCGYPKYLCHTDDNRVQFRFAEDVCAAAQKTEREQSVRASKKDYKGFGVKLSAEVYLTDDAKEAGMELSDFRRPYLIDQAKKKGLIPDDEAVVVSETTAQSPVESPYG